jgi:hypothetical protein
MVACCTAFEAINERFTWWKCKRVAIVNQNSVNYIRRFDMRYLFSVENCFSSNVSKICHYTAGLIILKCHFIVMASDELTSGR